ncbi:hypothetical protein GCM10028803_27970 [Larkinella knui]|uniref:Uncharacterized protein n=1 Tax=Larkinella knui TaxID=2025310 RepID=A0A3P1CWP2_9BACT|nr:fibronectin type III domain-containing protein [Larkinella knui]RRB17837.1 hypothetical protein EHT87_06040 [Larkinella knui]
MKLQSSLPQQFLLKGSTLLVALTILLGSCNDLKNLNPLKGVTYKLNYRPANTQIQGLVVDAKTGQSLTIPVQVTIFGKDASRVINFDGKAQTSYSSPKGDLFIGLRGDVPTRQAAAELRIVVDASGYIPSGVDLRLTTALNNPFIIRLVKKTDPPQGVAVKQDQVTLAANGTLQSEKEIGMASTSMTAPTTVQFASGTVMKDDKGNVVSGTLATAIAVYSPQATSIPVGLTTKVTQNGETTSTNVSLQIASYISINLTNSAGQSATSFTKPVVIKMGILPTFLNRSTGKLVQVGDKLAVYVRNEKTGNWAFVQDVKTEAMSTGLGVSFPVTHFTDYAVASAQPTSSSCRAVWNISGLADGYAYRYELVQNGSIRASGTTTDKALDLGEASEGPAELSIFSPAGNLLGKSSVQNLCGDHTLALSVPAGTVNVAFTVRASCENGKNIEVYPTVLVRYGKSGGDPSASVGVTFESGHGTLVGLEPNTSYEARVDYEGSWSEVFTTGTASESRNLNYVLKSHTEACK